MILPISKHAIMTALIAALKIPTMIFVMCAIAKILMISSTILQRRQWQLVLILVWSIMDGVTRISKRFMTAALMGKIAV